MCGIIGFTGNTPALPRLLSGLRVLSYRGYDSAGVALCGKGGSKIWTVKTAGRTDRLEEEIHRVQPEDNGCGIGHTRWATHGAATNVNAHPHTTENLALVHNGIIENYAELEAFLKSKGYSFHSETDTEAAACLIDYYYKKYRTPADALFKAVADICGSFAFAVIFCGFPGEIYAIRRDNPLIAAVSSDGVYVSSDPSAFASAFAGEVSEYFRPPNEILTVASPGSLNFFAESSFMSEENTCTGGSSGSGEGGSMGGSRNSGKADSTDENGSLGEGGSTGESRNSGETDSTDKNGSLTKKYSTVDIKPEKTKWVPSDAEISGFPHFMLKEIWEEPDVIRRTLEQCIKDDMPSLQCGELIKRADRIHIAACGTAMHAGLIGKAVIERFAGIPTEVHIASEFRYSNPIIGVGEILLVISQSGETADTLAALRYAKDRNIPTVGIVNVEGSTIAVESDHVIYTKAGPEIAVASTKAYMVQCAVLFVLAVQAACLRGKISREETSELLAALQKQAPSAASAVYEMSGEVKDAANEIKEASDIFYIGRSIDYSICAEGSLKLKEISYIHSEAFAAGELKHGTISLITEKTPVIALMTDPKVCAKTVSAVRETAARGAMVIAICTREASDSIEIPCLRKIVLPPTDSIFSVFPAATVFQLLAYHTAVLKGCDVDKPRNLAKSVTVE